MNHGFFFGKCLQPGNQKKKAGKSNKGIFEIFFKKSPYLDKKTQKLPDLDIVFL
jgi:hypothetical protein